MDLNLIKALEVGGPVVFFGILFFIQQRFYVDKVLSTIENNTKVLTELSVLIRERLR